MTPMTRKMLREVEEDEQARAAYPPRPARCDYRLVVNEPGTTTLAYTRNCKRPARASGLCWQHERSATR